MSPKGSQAETVQVLQYSSFVELQMLAKNITEILIGCFKEFDD